MNKIVKYGCLSLPVLFGFSITWVGSQIIRNEKNLEVRKTEVELQLHEKIIS